LCDGHSPKRKLRHSARVCSFECGRARRTRLPSALTTASPRKQARRSRGSPRVNARP
jgi:hypothetical protein